MQIKVVNFIRRFECDYSGDSVMRELGTDLIC